MTIEGEGFKTVKVPDLKGPTVELCWKQSPLTFERCDRRKGHVGGHTWQTNRKEPK